MIKYFLLTTSNLKRSSYVWNAASGITNALQSVILLIVITHTTGIIDAGIFSIAYAIANLTLTFGKYGMRNYQVTDVKGHYSVSEYIGSRTITCLLMFLASVVYTLYGYYVIEYSLYKCAVVMLMCFWKILDALEDVFHGWFQQKGRLDVAAKAATIRYSFGIIVFSLSLFVLKNLIVSSIICIIVSFVIFVIFTYKSIPIFGSIKLSGNSSKILHLLKTCFPLCCASFLTIYIGNAPKYAIDIYLSETIQAYYNFIFMPVFAIGLLASFVFNPILASLGEAWQKKNLQVIKRILFRQVLIIICITIVTIIAGYFFGTPILSWLYATELNEYKLEFCVLLLGGGIMALSALFAIVITTIRKHHALLFGYLFSALLAKVLAAVFVKNYGIMGASFLYTALMTILAISFIIMLLVFINQNQNKSSE